MKRVSLAVGPQGLSRDRARLLEAARLAFSAVRLNPTVQVVFDPRLSPDAIAALATVAPIRSSKDLESATTIVPEGIFVVREVALTEDILEFQGTAGPVPRAATLACGTNWHVEMR